MTYKKITTGQIGNNRSNKDVMKKLFWKEANKQLAQDIIDNCETKIKGDFFYGK